jgi:hypothetical protein
MRSTDGCSLVLYDTEIDDVSSISPLRFNINKMAKLSIYFFNLHFTICFVVFYSNSKFFVC